MDDDHRAVYQAVMEAQENAEAVALSTVIDTSGSVPRHAGSKMLVRADGSIVGTVGGGMMESLVVGEAIAALGDGQSRLCSYKLNDLGAGDPGVCGGTVQIFIEPVGIGPTLLVIGLGHVGRAVAELGKWMGFRVVVCDDRPEFCSPDYLSGMNGYVLCQPAEIARHTRINSSTFIAAVTRGMPVDVNLIPALLQTDAPYIGVIGSRRRWALTLKALQDEHGLTEEQLSRIHSPIGLELNAETPKEIAVSILAEITMLRRRGTGRPMSDRLQPDEEPTLSS